MSHMGPEGSGPGDEEPRHHDPGGDEAPRWPRDEELDDFEPLAVWDEELDGPELAAWNDPEDWRQQRLHAERNADDRDRAAGVNFARRMIDDIHDRAAPHGGHAEHGEEDAVEVAVGRAKGDVFMLLHEHHSGIVSVAVPLSAEQLGSVRDLLLPELDVARRPVRVNRRKIDHPRSDTGWPRRKGFFGRAINPVEAGRQDKERHKLLPNISGGGAIEQWVYRVRGDQDRQVWRQVVAVERWSAGDHPELLTLDFLVGSSEVWISEEPSDELMTLFGELEKRGDQPRSHGEHGAHGGHEIERVEQPVTDYAPTPLQDAYDHSEDAARRRIAELFERQQGEAPPPSPPEAEDHSVERRQTVERQLGEAEEAWKKARKIRDPARREAAYRAVASSMMNNGLIVAPTEGHDWHGLPDLEEARGSGLMIAGATREQLERLGRMAIRFDVPIGGPSFQELLERVKAAHPEFEFNPKVAFSVEEAGPILELVRDDYELGTVFLQMLDQGNFVINRGGGLGPRPGHQTQDTQLEEMIGDRGDSLEAARVQTEEAFGQLVERAGITLPPRSTLSEENVGLVLAQAHTADELEQFREAMHHRGRFGVGRRGELMPRPGDAIDERLWLAIAQREQAIHGASAGAPSAADGATVADGEAATVEEAAAPGPAAPGEAVVSEPVAAAEPGGSGAEGRPAGPPAPDPRLTPETRPIDRLALPAAGEGAASAEPGGGRAGGSLVAGRYRFVRQGQGAEAQHRLGRRATPSVVYPPGHDQFEPLSLEQSELDGRLAAQLTRVSNIADLQARRRELTRVADDMVDRKLWRIASGRPVARIGDDEFLSSWATAWNELYDDRAAGNSVGSDDYEGEVAQMPGSATGEAVAPEPAAAAEPGGSGGGREAPRILDDVPKGVIQEVTRLIDPEGTFRDLKLADKRKRRARAIKFYDELYPPDSEELLWRRRVLNEMFNF